MRESLEKLVELADKHELNDSELKELLKTSLLLTSWALERNARCITDEKDRKEMVVIVLSLLTSRIFRNLNIEQRNIIINPTDPEVADSNTGCSNLVGNC